MKTRNHNHGILFFRFAFQVLKLVLVYLEIYIFILFRLREHMSLVYSRWSHCCVIRKVFKIWFIRFRM